MIINLLFEAKELFLFKITGMKFSRDTRENIVTPGHRQLANTIVRDIEKGELLKDDLLPLIPELCKIYGISLSEFFITSYHLEDLGVLNYRGSKLYNIRDTDIGKPLRFMIFCGEGVPEMLIKYDSALICLSKILIADYFVHHNDPKLVKKLLKKHEAEYDKVVYLNDYQLLL